MKFRTDFVTNSSSSSFIIINIKSEKLTNIISEYKGLLQDSNSDWYIPSVFNVDNYNNSLIFEQDECWCDLYMEEDNLECLVDTILNFFDEVWVEEEKQEEMRDFVKTFKENKNEIINDVEEISIQDGNLGWQGDDESRFWPDWYEPECLEGILDAIAAEENCKVEEIDNEMFSDYVCDKTSEEINYITYKKETGKITKSRTTDLL